MRPSRQRGFALLLVLWGLALIAAIALAIGQTVRSEALIARNAVDNAEARHAAEAGFELGVARLIAARSQPGAAFFGEPWQVDFAEAQLEIRIRDEGGKVDLNAAPPELILRLLLVLGVPAAEAEHLADAILDWRDGDDEPRAQGAERAAYVRAGFAYGPRNAPFESVEELCLVIGVSEALCQRILPEVTTHSGATGIDPTVASATVLAALPGQSPASIASLLARRRSSTVETGNPVSSSPYVALSTAQAFEVAVAAQSRHGGRASVSGIVWLTDRRDQPYLLLAWRR